jgi:glycosyltransferase involved in cell wall biosynthesis
MFTKNGMPYVREAVASLQTQSFDDFELVIQDSASTDGTAEFLRQVGLARVRMVSEPDTGLGDAYNRAFSRCTGEIVGTLDADNLIVPNALRTVDALFRRHRTAHAVYGAVRMIDASGRELRTFIPQPFDARALMRCELVPPFSTSYFNRRRCGSELRGDASLTTAQDFELWLRLSSREIIRTTEVLGATRLSHKSMTRNPANYEYFCAEKIAALDGFIARRPQLQPHRTAAVAGIYCWAAESLLEIEGPSPRFESFVDRAATLSLAAERLQRLRQRARGGSREPRCSSSGSSQ